MSETDEILISSPEAAEVLGVSRATVLRWAESGSLPFVRKMRGKNGAVLFDAGVVRRKAQERLLHRQSVRSGS